MSDRALCYNAWMHTLCIPNFKMSLIKVEIILGIYIIIIYFHKDCIFHVQKYFRIFWHFLNEL
jgi:hypothetical protein